MLSVSSRLLGSSGNIIEREGGEFGVRCLAPGNRIECR
jgi:hypothetical protein